jgi:hypothetical protein
MPDQPCSACGGTGQTAKVEYTYERDANGNLVPVAHHVYGTCSSCGGSGRIA